MQKRNHNKGPIKKEAEHRINNFIRVSEVRLVGDNVEPGVYSLDQAKKWQKS